MTNTIKRFVNKNILRQQFQPIEIVGIPTAKQPDLSSAGEARVFYDSTLDAVRVSRNGAAYGSVLDGSSATPSEVSKLSGITGYPVQCAEVLFVETGAGTYTGSVSLPAGATLLDIIVHTTALWTAATSAAMIVGDAADDNGFFTGIDLKATDLLVAESINFSHPGGKQGADLDSIDVGGEGGLAASANVHVRRRYLATTRVISGIVTTVGAGTGGRTRMLVLWMAAGAQTTATKV